MGFSSHEMLIMLRARDEASRILNRVSTAFGTMNDSAKRSAIAGVALSSAGILMTGTGVALAKALYSTTNASAEFTQGLSLAQTQLDGAKSSVTGATITFDDLKKVAIDTATAIPVKFKETTGALYDIFSSFDTTLEGSKELMITTGKAAIAGSIDMQTAGKGIMEVLNGWKLSADQSTRVSDVLFKMTQKGVGTFEQFSNSIGRSIPSAVKAGASIEDMGGAMAFLTRNGLSTQMAATALGRAFDLVANPKFEQAMRKNGMSTRDAQGNFLDLTNVTEQLRQKMKNMSEGQKADFLKELTKGAGGTVQALRFMTHALNDEDKAVLNAATGQTEIISSLQDFTNEMKTAGGATEEAYKLMSNTPEAKFQQLSNSFDIFKTAIGDALMPVRLFITEGLTKLFDWFNKLDPSIQKNIAIFASIAAIVMVVGGAILTIVGIIMLFNAAISVLPVGAFMALLSPIGLVIAAIVALIAVGYLIVTNWELIKSTAINVWNGIVQFMQPVIQGFMYIGQYVMDMVGRMLPALQNAWNNVTSSLTGFVTMIMSWINPAIQKLQAAFAAAQPALSAFGNIVLQVFGVIGSILAWIGTFVVNVVIAAFVFLGSVVSNIFGGLAAGLSIMVSGIMTVLTGFFNLITAIFTNDGALLNEAIGQIFGGLVQTVLGLFAGLAGALYGLVNGIVTGVINFFKYLYDVLVGHSIIPDMVIAIIDWIAKLPGQIVAIIVTLVIGFIAKVTELATTVIAKFVTFVAGIVFNVSQLPGKIAAFIEDMKLRVISIVTSMVSAFVIKVVSWVNDVASNAAQLPGRVTSGLSFLGSMITGVASSAWNSFSSAVTSGLNNVVSIVFGGPSRIVSALGNIGGLLVNSGTQLVNGFIGGIQDMAGRAANAARNVIDNAIRAAQRALGIASPSKVFYWIGEMSVKGMENAFNAGQSVMAKAGDSLARASIADPNDYMLTADYNKTNYGQTFDNGRGRGQVNVVVNTEEINPVKHAAELGYEISGRLG